jgi:hypothetical protein
MDASKVASAYLNSLVHHPGSHLFTLDAEPLPQLVLTDLSLWIEGFRCGELGENVGNRIPHIDEVFVWVDLALQRYFHEQVPAVEAEPLKVRAQAAAATYSDETQTVERAERPRPLSVPTYRLGFSAR